NKVKGSARKRSYDEKKREILSSRTSLVEIDLLREGTPLYAGHEGRDADYLVQVWRWTEARHRRILFPIALRDRLPAIPIPVRAGDDDAALDLQLMLDTVYDRAGYDLRVDYSRKPTPALTVTDSDWAEQIVTSDGPAGQV